MAGKLTHRLQHEEASRSLLTGFRVQMMVIGALLMREIHTRYGRENIGYLWMFGEPALLALAVSALHGFHSLSPSAGSDIHPVPFAIGGYCTFIIFRAIIIRAEQTIEANGSLLYHRRVTLFDMLFARSLLEGVSVATAMTVLLTACVLVGFGPPPARPLTLMTGIAAFTWFSFGMSMLTCAATHENRIVEKFLHPTVYIMMPISGAFYMLKWLPEPYRTWMSWSPINQMFEVIHAGQFQSADTDLVSWPYIIGWCLVLTYCGMMMLGMVRRRIHLS